MPTKWRIMILVAALAVASAAAEAGVRRHRARPTPLCGLPPADYQPPQPPPAAVPALLVSSPGVPLDPPPAAADGAAAMSLQIPGGIDPRRLRLKVFQFPTAGVTIDHCSASRIALTIREDGFWRVNLRADQNPQVTAPNVVTPPVGAAPIRALPAVRLKETIYLKRNLFVVKFRGLGLYREALPTPPAPPPLGKPVLLDLCSIPFWVQRGVPYDLVRQGYCPDAGLYFDRIDRVEMEFSYR
ncbi:MAG TPA: hypothetical protein VG406_17695 [Isosphaeraceae bacterium]|nr:hypothetical protein [Isosphaeraceae bacterium]